MNKITNAEAMRLLLNEMNKPIDREVLWDYMRMTPKQTGLPYDIFVDNGGEYKNNHHDLWLFVVDGDNLIPVTVSEHPIVKTLVHNPDISLEPVRVFIRNNHKRLKGLADGKAMMDLFFTGIKPYHSSLNESTERLDEMSKVYRHESGLPTVIWVDEDNLSHQHAQRIKFRANFQNKNSRNDPSMEINDPQTLHNYDEKHSDLTNKEVEIIRSFVKLNKEPLLQLDRREITHEDFLKSMTMVDKEGNPLEKEKPIIGKEINGFRIVQEGDKFDYLDDDDNYVFGNFPLDKAGEFNEYGAGKLLACVIKDGREFFIDTEGNEVAL